MTQSPVRFAILGFGHHAVRRLLPGFANCKDAVLNGMWRRNQATAQADCVTHNIPRCFGSREELCASPEIDAVFITSPDAMHREDALLAFKHGKAVLCEKPLAMSATQAEEMVAAATSAGVLFGVAQNFRYNRSLEWMRDKIASGAIGEPQLARAEFCYPAQNASRKWIMDPGLACGGPIGDVGVHCIDALRFVLRGEVEKVSTMARTDEYSPAVEAVALLQMEMTGGVLATVTTSARAAYRTLVEIVGSDGVLIAENGLTVDRPVDVQLRRAGEAVETVTLNNGDGYTRMLDGFAAAYRGGAEFAASGTDGVANMLALDAAYESWRRNSAVIKA